MPKRHAVHPIGGPYCQAGGGWCRVKAILNQCASGAGSMRRAGISSQGRAVSGAGIRGRPGILAWGGAALLLALPSPAPAQADTTPPVLAGFSFSPAAIDTTAGPATVVVTIHATDDLSGVASVRATFSNR